MSVGAVMPFLCVFLLPFSRITCTGEEDGRRNNEQILQRRNAMDEGSATDSPYPLRFADENFANSLASSLRRLSLHHRPLLIHTKLGEDDSLVFLRENDEIFAVDVVSLPYNNLKAISHLPVSVVALLAPELAQLNHGVSVSLSSATLSDLNQVLQVMEQTRTIIADTFSEEEQRSRQYDIIMTSSQFVSDIVTRSKQLSLYTVREFGSSLRQRLMENSQDAVFEYLMCLNDTISRLLEYGNITAQEFQNMTVLIDIQPFTEPNNFILQYYEQLLDYRFQTDSVNTERIILMPAAVYQNSTLLFPNTSTAAQSNTALKHTVTTAFYGQNSVYSSPHISLYSAATEIICSSKLTFPSCGDHISEDDFPPGYRSPANRAYIITLVFVTASSIVLSVFLGCVCNEGNIMKKERNIEAKLGITGVLTVSRNFSLSGDSVKINKHTSHDERDGGKVQREPGVRRHKTVPRVGKDVMMRRKISNQRVKNWRKKGHYSLTSEARPPVTYSEVTVFQ